MAFPWISWVAPDLGPPNLQECYFCLTLLYSSEETLSHLLPGQWAWSGPQCLLQEFSGNILIWSDKGILMEISNWGKKFKKERKKRSYPVTPFISLISTFWILASPRAWGVRCTGTLECPLHALLDCCAGVPPFSVPATSKGRASSAALCHRWLFHPLQFQSHSYDNLQLYILILLFLTIRRWTETEFTPCSVSITCSWCLQCPSTTSRVLSIQHH